MNLFSYFLYINKGNKLFLGLALLYFAPILTAQNSVFRHSFSYQLVVSDYCSLDPQYRAERAARPRFMYADDVNYAAQLSYAAYLNPHFNLKAGLRIGSVDAYHLTNAEGDSSCQPCMRRFYPQEFATSVELNALYKLNNGYILPEKLIMQPYAVLGLAAVYFDKRTQHFDLQIPMGLGMNMQIAPQMSLQTQIEYRPALISKKQNLGILFGIVWLWGDKDKTKATPSTN